MLRCVSGIVFRVLYSSCVTTCVFVVLYRVYVYVFCCTPSVGVCVLLYIGCRCMCCVLHYVYVLYNVMGQEGMRLLGTLLIFGVEAI